MWIVKLALTRPYTFIVLAVLIALLGPLSILKTPTDIFPNINIPVISVAFTFNGMNAEELEGRLTTPFEKILSTLVDNVEHIESTTYNGAAIIKVFLQPGAQLDTANAQVVASSNFEVRYLPPSTQPPEIINYSASSVPILQIGLSGLSEPQLNDYGLNFVRTQLITIPGAVVPYPYGGKQRQVMVSLNQRLMQSKGVSPLDVLNAVQLQNLIVPSGTAKIGSRELDIRLNTAPQVEEELGNIPIKQIGNSTLYLRDVATVGDGFAPQTNVVRQDGHRGVLVSVIKAGNASTIDVVNGVKNILPHVATLVPPEMKMTPLADQSIFVRDAVNGVIREGVIAAALTGIMILLFLGSWRSTLIIAVSIPLSILSSIIALSMLGETINIMTLGGLALAVGILVDDATVTIENIKRFLEEGHELNEGILQGAAQIAAPAFVSTLCICIVFMPMFLLQGVARYLFVPLAEAVVFAMLASYVLSRTLVPTMAMYLLKAKAQRRPSQNLLARFQRGFERGFERVRGIYHDILIRLVGIRRAFVPIFIALCLSASLLLPFLGQDFFPSTDAGEFILHVRGATGLRIEETARLCDFVEDFIRKEIPADQIDTILDNIGLPYSPYNTMHSTSGVIGAADADILVSLKKNHSPTADYVRNLRKKLPGEFPSASFYFLPADIVTQILNFGLPSPIDVQIEGKDSQVSHDIAEKLLVKLREIPGLVDLRIQQPLDYPTVEVSVDRTKANQGGFTEQDVSSSVINTLSGSSQITPMFFLNPKNGVNYNLVVQTPQYSVQSLQDLQNIPIISRGKPSSEILADLTNFKRSREMAVVSHYNTRRTIDIYGAVQDRDLGGVATEIEKIVDGAKKDLPRGTFITLKGQVDTMRSSYLGLLEGLGFAIILVYLLIVVTFQSWLDPFIIITALPAALAGIIILLFLTHTPLSVPALMGAIMCMGVATANSILVVTFAKQRLEDKGDAIQASIDAGFTRFRPVLMTALAMIIGMVPMALGLGDGGEENAPLGCAVIGGLMFATVATLVFVPCVFALLHSSKKTRLGEMPDQKSIASSPALENGITS